MLRCVGQRDKLEMSDKNVTAVPRYRRVVGAFTKHRKVYARATSGKFSFAAAWCSSLAPDRAHAVSRLGSNGLGVRRCYLI